MAAILPRKTAASVEPLRSRPKPRPLALRAFKKPGDGFGGQAVEGGNGELEVGFGGVLDFVVADAAKGLHEEHDGWNAGARDFGSVVERTGGHAVGGAGHFLDGLVAERDEFGMEGDGCDVPDARPF